MGWEETRDRLEQAYTLSSMEHVQVRKADIRAAVERMDHYESAFDRATEWIEKHLPDTPSGPLILDVLRQRVEELERERDATQRRFEVVAEQNALAGCDVSALRERAEAAEAKLARCVEVLRAIKIRLDEGLHCGVGVSTGIPLSDREREIIRGVLRPIQSALAAAKGE